ncbi:MAG TPA: CBS domain-containing protein [Terriglobales bacterium]|nr:CBS domain-containing protein [Terriglobales bacterium]
MSLLQIADQNPTVTSPDATVLEAMRKMLDNHVGAVCVLDSERRVAGIFTERDVMRELVSRGFNPASTRVRDLMTTSVEMATELTTEAEALSIMLERHYRHLPIIDQNARLLGMLSIRHVLEARIDELVEELDRMKSENIKH